MACAPVPTDTHNVAVNTGQSVRQLSRDSAGSFSFIAPPTRASDSCLSAASDAREVRCLLLMQGPGELVYGDGHSAQETLDVTSLTVELGCTSALLTQDGQQTSVLPSRTLLPFSMSTASGMSADVFARAVDPDSLPTQSSVDVSRILPFAAFISVQHTAAHLSANISQGSQGPENVKNVLGPLLGGLLGGFFGLIIIFVLIWCLWRRRYDIFYRTDSRESMQPSDVNDFKYPERSRRQSAPPSPVPTPQPYHYGLVGRPLSTTSTSSVRHSPGLSQSRSHSPSVLTTYSPPPSAAASTYMHMSTTPIPGSSTAISPGPSLASSSRASTPGLSYPTQLQQYRYELQQQQQQQLQQGRLSWPRYGSSDDGHDERRSPVLRPRSERRPSRLSLTLANWNPETDGELPVMSEGPSERNENDHEDETGAGTSTVNVSVEGSGGGGWAVGEEDAETIVSSQRTVHADNSGPLETSGLRSHSKEPGPT